MTVPLELTVDSTDKLNRYFLMRVPMRIPHVGSLVDQHVVQNVAVAFGGILQLLAEVRQILHVIAIDFCIVGFVRWNVAVVGRSMPRSIKSTYREVGGSEVAAQHQCGDAGDIGLESHRHQVVHDLEMVIVFRRYAERDLERRTRRFRLAGYILDSPFNLADIFKIVVQLGPIARRDAFLDKSNLVSNGIEDAASSFSIRNPFVHAGAVAEQPLERHTGIDFGWKRRRRRRPGNGVRVTAAVAPIAVTGIVARILDTELNGWQ